jgi:hypothetical protein
MALSVRVFRRNGFQLYRPGRGSIRLTGIDDASPEYAFGLRNGDLLLEIVGQTFTNIVDAQHAVSTAPLPFWIIVEHNNDHETGTPAAIPHRPTDAAQPRRGDANDNRTGEPPAQRPRTHGQFRPNRITLEYGHPCSHCGFRWLAGERRSCRDEGDSSTWCCDHLRQAENAYPHLHDLPDQLKQLYLEYSNHMSPKSFQYNNNFAMAAVGVAPGEHAGGEGFVNQPLARGNYLPSCVKIQGRIYHRLLHGAMHGPVQCLIYSAPDEAVVLNPNQNLEPAFVGTIRGVLYEINPHFNAVRRLAFADNDNFGVRLRTATDRSEVAAIIPSQPYERQTTRTIVVYRNTEERPEFLRADHALYEALSYPLLFPYGEEGWSRDRRRRVKLLRYLRTRLIRPERSLVLPNGHTVNRFQLLSRLGQVYMVDGVSRVVEANLEWLRFNQQQFFGDGYEAAQQEGRTFLPDSVHGSPRHRRTLAANALALLAKMGKPTFFITATCNPAWPEIQRELVGTQTAYDRPDITARVFRSKLRVLLKHIRRGDVFGYDHRPVYELSVIEFQKRGLPHTHVVIRLNNVPEDNFVEERQFIDKHVFASIPPEDDPELLGLVNEFMLHEHGSHCASSNRDGSCNKRFPKPVVQTTTRDDRGIVQYRRRVEDANVVAYNPALLRMWDGHINVEYSGSSLIVLYLYKYIYKGPDRVSFSVNNLEDADEITQFVNHRYLSSMEAMWRVLGYHTYPGPRPSVVCIKVHLPRDEDRRIGRNQQPTMSDFLLYLHRPEVLADFKFDELFAHYRVTSDRSEVPRDREFVETTLPYRTYYYYRRQATIITRIGMIYPGAGELWFLRLICGRRPVCSYADARTVDEIEYGSYQEAAVAAGYVNQAQEESTLALHECLLYETPRELRSLFVMLTLEGYPTLEAFQDHDLRTAMMADFALDNRSNFPLAYQQLLKDLQQRFKAAGKEMAEFGLDEPESDDLNEVELERRRYDVDEQRRILATDAPLTDEQQAAYEEILGTVMRGRPAFFFIQGRGGAGKSHVLRRLLTAVRASGRIGLVCATTALAASLFDNGTTAHHLFGLPVREDPFDQEELRSKVTRDADRLELLRSASLIVWDEFPNANKELFEAAYNLLDSFQGITFVGSGDFRQIPPVVPSAGRPETAYASVTRSHLWRQFRVLQLTQSFRDRNDPEYAAFALGVGDGSIGEDPDPPRPHSGEKIVELPIQFFVHERDNVDQAISFVYPTLGDVNQAFDANRSRAILATTNEAVDEWNRMVQARRPGEAVQLYSTDHIAETDDPDNRLAEMVPPAYLHTLNESNVPPHELVLKLGDVCILVRNLAKNDKLTNNQRVQILEINQHTLRVQLLVDNTIHTIPRIHLLFRTTAGSFQIRRTQFPLRLGYALSFNKSQGQTLERVLLDLRQAPFCHGHLYVGLTRVVKAADIAAFCCEHQATQDNRVRTTNVYWPELTPSTNRRNGVDND